MEGHVLDVEPRAPSAASCPSSRSKITPEVALHLKHVIDASCQAASSSFISRTLPQLAAR